MVCLLTAEEMRETERGAMESGRVASLDLMERAGRGAVAAILETWPAFAAMPAHAVVLCGPGNNGGDGFVVARLLQARGWVVEVLLLGDAERVRGDARVNLDRWAALGAIAGLGAAGSGARPDLLVDALFGTGLSRPIPQAAAEAWHAVLSRAGAGPVARVALDCPSGFDVDRGVTLGAHRPLDPDLCVTFHAPKVGHYLAPAAAAAPVVVDIGLGSWDDGAAALMASAARARLIAPQRDHGRWLAEVSAIFDGGHKYDRGHAVVLGGGPGRGGAARMAARAALRAGAGLVTLACPPEALAENAGRLDAVMLRPVADAEALAEMLEDDRQSVVCLGPGLGIGAGTRDLVRTVLGTGRRAVLDADAMTSFTDDPDTLFGLLHDGAVLTPHEGEFARLFPDLAQSPREKAGLSKLDAARKAAERSGAVVLLKGAATVVARPDGVAGIHPALYDRAVPQLATAGAGDVLAGFATGLIASGRVEVGPAVELGVWLHAECARRFGPGLIAEDLPEMLPAVLRGMI